MPSSKTTRSRHQGQKQKNKRCKKNKDVSKRNYTGVKSVELKIGTLLLSAYVLYVYDYFNLYRIFKVGTTTLFPQYCLWSPCLPIHSFLSLESCFSSALSSESYSPFKVTVPAAAVITTVLT